MLKFFKKLKEENKSIQDKENTMELKANKIISTYKMFKKRKVISAYFRKLKLLQRYFKRFIWKKNIIKIVKIQSLLRKKYLIILLFYLLNHHQVK